MVGRLERHCGDQGRFVAEGPGALGKDWRADWPITYVNYADAKAYADWLAKREGVRWALPTEFEYERAARGADGRTYPWGEFIDPTWCCIQESRPDVLTPVSVHEFPVDESPHGIRGLAGNVATWCTFVPAQWRYVGSRTVIPRAMALIPPGTIADWPERGGAFSGTSWEARASSRRQTNPKNRRPDCGIRLVRAFPG